MLPVELVLVQGDKHSSTGEMSQFKPSLCRFIGGSPPVSASSPVPKNGVREVAMQGETAKPGVGGYCKERKCI